MYNVNRMRREMVRTGVKHFTQLHTIFQVTRPKHTARAFKPSHLFLDTLGYILGHITYTVRREVLKNTHTRAYYTQ